MDLYYNYNYEVCIHRYAHILLYSQLQVILTAPVNYFSKNNNQNRLHESIVYLHKLVSLKNFECKIYFRECIYFSECKIWLILLFYFHIHINDHITFTHNHLPKIIKHISLFSTNIPEPKINTSTAYSN